jgi:eukaryotic-like serine/threonine-protein kinase
MSSPVGPGTVLAGKYRVDRVVGEGGMGVVVLATDEQLERKVAIKFLLPQYAQHHEAAPRFLREARAAVKIRSEHVARVIDVGTMENGAPYMVMEYLEGKDLAAVLDERQRLPVEEAVAHVLEACDAIAEAHSVGIVHRDLKPANLFLTRQPDGSSRIKVLDFGISKALVTGGTGTDPSLTRTSSMMGSPLYMSPEQMKSAKNVDPRTDVWALGVILYELLTGEPPFNAESIPELSAKVLLEEPVAIRATRPDVPEALEAAVKRALAKDTAQRFPTVADLAHAIAPFGPARTRANVERASRVLKVSGMASVTSEAGAPPTASTEYARTAAAWADSAGAASTQTRGRGAVIGAAVAAVVALGVGVFLVAGRGGSAQPQQPSSAGVSTIAAPEVHAAPLAPTQQAPALAPAPAASAAPSAVVVPVLPSAEPAAPAVDTSKGQGAAKPLPPARVKPSSKSKAEVKAEVPAADPLSGFGSRK